MKALRPPPQVSAGWFREASARAAAKEAAGADGDADAGIAATAVATAAAAEATNGGGGGGDPGPVAPMPPPLRVLEQSEPAREERPQGPGHGQGRHGFFIWNCGPRAGASQYHGHGQLMLTRTPVPEQVGG